jgi:prepilin-type N-terminal cleavage/methylation domain-containing protein
MSHPRRFPRGFTLVEVLLAMGALTIVLGLCAGLLHVLLRLDRTGRDYVTETASVGRLARQFRTDVHAASESRALDPDQTQPARLKLTLPDDRTIVYEARPRIFRRTERRRGAVERQETYSLPFCRAGQFVVKRDQGRLWVQLRLCRGAEPAGRGGAGILRHDLQIDALAGKDTRAEPANRDADRKDAIQ